MSAFEIKRSAELKDLNLWGAALLRSAVRATALKILFAAYISIFTKALPSRTIGKVASTTLGGSPP